MNIHIDTSNANIMDKLVLHTFQQGGVLSLIECTLIEEPDASDEDCESPSHSVTVPIP